MELDELLRLDPAGRGARPFFHADPAVERVLDVALVLAQELAVTRLRLDALERVLSTQGGNLGAAVDAYEPDAAAAAARAAWQREYLQRVLRALREDGALP
jgi:hypothetical protein